MTVAQAAGDGQTTTVGASHRTFGGHGYAISQAAPTSSQRRPKVRPGLPATHERWSYEIYQEAPHGIAAYESWSVTAGTDAVQDGISDE